MKRVITLITLISIIIFTVTSCTAEETSNNISAVTPDEDNISDVNTEALINYPDIQVQSPMTLSNSMCTFNGQSVYLRLKMVKGRYFEDWNPGAYMGTLWEGQFDIDLADESGKIIAETDISKIFNESLTFNSSFNIEFDDYNNDGDMDFTIGQYGSSNGYVYRILTLRKNGKVEQLLRTILICLSAIEQETILRSLIKSTEPPLK